MEIIVLGINHKTAALKTREKVAFADKHLREACRFLERTEAVRQCVILSTCNRSEIYALAAGPSEGRTALIAMLEAVRGVTFAELDSCSYLYSGFDAVNHLFRVTTGLDSMLIGETQILGQVKEAYAKGCANGAVGKELHGLFQQAVSCAKKVQTETGINDNAVSVSYLAVDMIKSELGSFDGLAVLVIGAGKMSRLTLRHLFELGAKDIRVTSRTYERARDLAHFFNGRTIDFSRKIETLQEIDIIISSTGAPHLLLRKEEMIRIMEKRRHRPIFIIDIAVPRDIDPAVGELENVYLYDMDSLQRVVDRNLKERAREATLAEEVVSEEASEYCEWLKTLRVTPVIRALRKKVDKIRAEETGKCVDGKLRRLSAKEKEAVENLTKSIVNAILKEPIIRMKDDAVNDNHEDQVEALMHLFNLQQEIESGMESIKAEEG